MGLTGVTGVVIGVVGIGAKSWMETNCPWARGSQYPGETSKLTLS